MNHRNEVIALPTAQPLPKLSTDAPVPKLVGTLGLELLQRGVARRVVPTMTSDDVEALDDAYKHLKASVVPAAIADLACEYEKLALDYSMLRREGWEAEISVRQFSEDFSDWPTDLVEAACSAWRNSSKERFPTAGQLKAPFEVILRHRTLLLKRADDFFVELRNSRS